jgi:photosynthetic reaction center cytochrome c subunit
MSRLARVSLAVVILLGVAACERPPVDTEQLGYRGTGIQQVTNPRIDSGAANIPAPLPPATTQGPRAGDVYQNVEVLGDLSVPQFTRLMQSITTWVAPEQGCNYCHVPGESLASDSLYTKVVARRMLQMNLAVNASWSDHVGATGVTCYTCHRGNNVPEYGWYSAATGEKPMVGYDGGQNKASAEVGVTSLPYDPFSDYLTAGAQSIRVLGEQPLPSDQSTASIQATERSYALMIHLSKSLGVNCTYCHNSRAFGLWEESTPKRETAWYGLQMVRSLNSEYLQSVQSVLPANRLGVNGDVQKVSCMTCHQGAALPLDGAAMLADHPELTAAR